MEGQPEKAGEPCRVQRHVSINNSLVHLEDCVQDLEAIIDRIKGSKGISETPLDQKPHEPCLAEIMENTPVRVDGLSERVSQAIGQLNQTIF